MKKVVVTILLLFCVTEVVANGVKYLIITHNNFTQAIQPLAQWKNKKGLPTRIVQFSTCPDTSVIKDSIRYYHPEFVLLVGSDFPLYNYRTTDSTFLFGVESDNYYGDTSGDYRMEIPVGRFPVSNENVTQCSTVVAKVLAYERTPYISDTAWFCKGTTIANNTDTDSSTWWNYYRANCMYGRELMLNVGYTYIDTFFNAPSESIYNVDSVINAINNGRSYVLYRGESKGNWTDPFHVDPDSTNNGSKLPVIVTGGCATIGSQTNYGASWIIAGSPDTLKGAEAYLGTTYIPFENYFASHFRGTFVTGWYNAVFLKNSNVIGKAVLTAKDSVYQQFLSNETMPVHYVEWNLLGDPELNLWTAVPKSMIVTHSNIIQPGSQQFTITVKDEDTIGISNALVCVMMPNDTSVYDAGYTNNSGNITFTINPTKISDSIWITVTDRNYRPYEGKCMVELSATEYSTFPNQGRHIVHKPNTSELHMVYENNGSIYYSKTTNSGQSWSRPKYLGDGSYPCIGIGPNGGTPWVLWGSTEEYGPIYSAIKRPDPDTTWKIRELVPFGEYEVNVTSPAIVLATLDNEDGDLAYSVFRTYDRIYFCAYDSLYDYYVYEVDNNEPCYAPSISLTPGDYIHIVWQRGQDNIDGKIYYRTTLDVVKQEMFRDDEEPKWSDKYNISYIQGYPSQPASNPFTETYGDSVYAVWRGPNENGDTTLGDIWQRARFIWSNPDVWSTPVNQSQTENSESNYPVMANDFTTVWHEQVDSTNWDIWGKFRPELYSEPLFETSTSSKYPHIAGYWDPNPSVPPTFCVNTIWTEETDSNSYEVKFDCYRYEYNPPEEGNVEKLPPYYIVGIGNIIQSPYCTERSGHVQYNPYRIDYGNLKIKYKLPFLHPSYYYNLRAIVYQQGQGNWSQSFDIDSNYSTTINFEPNRPETMWIRIPQESYKNDATIKHEIKKILGNRAVIADLRLYQDEEFTTSEGGGSGPQSIENNLIQRPILYQSYPNPFKSQTAICYSLTSECNVSLLIYDVSGRLIKTLIKNLHQTSNIYSVNWDGRDDKGRTVAQGIYFYRLRTDGFSDIKRIALIR